MLVERQELIDWIGRADIVIVRAHAGAGKSTFAEQLIGTWHRRVLRFRGGSWTAADLRAGLDAAEKTTASDDVTIFFDDAHLAPEAEIVAATSLIDQRPSSPKIVVCARRVTAFDALDSRSDARTVDGSQLRHTGDQIGAMLAAAGLIGAVVRDDLFTTTNGWPVLVARAIDRLRHEPGWTPSGPNGVLALTHDLLRSFGESADGLATLARLPLVDAEIAAMVAPDAFDLVPMERLGRWRVMPPALASTLRAAGGSSSLTDGMAAQIARRYIALGEIAAAVRLVVAECAPDEAVDVLDAVHWTGFADLDPWLLRDVVTIATSAPSDGAGAWVLLAAARASEYADRDRWTECLELALARSGEGTSLRRAVQADVARHRLRGGDVQTGVEIAESVLVDLDESEITTRARALAVLAMADAFESTPASCASSARRYREAAELFRRSSEWAWRADALARLGYTALFLAGHPVQGEAAMADALALLPVADRVRASWLTYYADVLDNLGRSVDAEAVLRESIEIGERLHDEGVLGLSWWGRSWLASHRGDTAAFRIALAEVERHRGDWLQGGQEVEYLASTAEHSLLVGDMSVYTTMMSRAAELGEEIGYLEPVEIANAWFEATDGDPVAGRDALLRLEGSPAVVAVNRPRRLLLLAVAHLRTGDVSAARTTADQAFQAAASMGLPDLHARMHRRLLDLLASVLDEAATTTAVTGPASLTLRMLGGFSVIGADGAARTPQPGHPSTLVKLLALNGAITVDSAVDRLWPEADAMTGRSRLRNVLNRLKDRSGQLVVRQGDTLLLADDVIIDVVEFERAAADALAAAAEERVGRSRRAVSLYTGDLLPGDVYEDWASGHRERLRRRFVSLADIVAADAEMRGDTDEAARLLDLALQIEPLDEVRSVRLCGLLLASGHTMGAAAVATRCIDLLTDLGVEPSGELQRFAIIAV